MVEVFVSFGFDAVLVLGFVSVFVFDLLLLAVAFEWWSDVFECCSEGLCDEVDAGLCETCFVDVFFAGSDPVDFSQVL